MIENLVIGGGPAGSMVALRLTEAGRPVTLIERERGPHHKVCGEFLSPEAGSYLGQVGIDLRELGARPIDRVRLHAGRTPRETPLPFRAMSLSRRTLDEALLEQAGKKGCDVRRGVQIESLTRTGELWRAGVRGAEPIWARTVFLATGKHEVGGWARGKGTQPDLIGFKMHWRLRSAQIDALHGAMELYLFPGGYGGMSLVEGDAATFCFVVHRSRLQKAGGWARVVQEIRRGNACVDERLEGAEALYEKPLAIAPIPYGYLANEDRGIWCVGDQAAVIPSFTGDGMSIALHSAALAAQMFLEGKSIADFIETLRAHLSKSMRLATFLSKLVLTGTGRRLSSHALRLVPGAMRWIASGTRIPQRALAASRAPRAQNPAVEETRPA